MSEQEEDTRHEDRESKETINIPLTALLQWIPIWLAIVGLFLSAANVYANVMTRIGTLETRLNLYSEVLTDLRGTVSSMERRELRDRQEGQDREQKERNGK